MKTMIRIIASLLLVSFCSTSPMKKNPCKDKIVEREMDEFPMKRHFRNKDNSKKQEKKDNGAKEQEPDESTIELIEERFDRKIFGWRVVKKGRTEKFWDQFFKQADKFKEFNKTRPKKKRLFLPKFMEDILKLLAPLPKGKRIDIYLYLRPLKFNYGIDLDKYWDEYKQLEGEEDPKKITHSLSRTIYVKKIVKVYYGKSGPIAKLYKTDELVGREEDKNMTTLFKAFLSGELL